MKNLWKCCLFVPFLMFQACMSWEYDEGGADIELPSKGLFILNEGNFQYGNASLSFYYPPTSEIENEIFQRANGMKLGDVAQSMTIHDNSGWIVVNNSNVVFAIDLSTCKEKGRITNFTSPRYIHFINDEKAYVTQLWDNRIFIVNPKKYAITGYIEVPGMAVGSGSTEQMVQIGNYVYCTCWSYQDRIIKIDSENDSVVESLQVGIQPSSMVQDAFNRLWVLTDGGYEGSPFGYEDPSLVCINTDTFTIEKKFSFKNRDLVRSLALNGSRDMIYWINRDVWKMDVSAERLPVESFISNHLTKFYSLTVDPETDEVYVGDAIDYQQPGILYRYSREGDLMDEIRVGITPGNYCWKE